jgi:hypothetical protein
MSDPSSNRDDPEVEGPTSELAADATTEPTTLADLLERPLSRSARDPAAPSCLIGECIDARHPSLQGRILVKFSVGGHEHERWVPTLQGLPVRVADRVLMLQPDNAQEWVVTGVVDGFATRPRPPLGERARIELQRDEAVNVVSSEGTRLIEISQSEAGPVVRVLEPDVQVEFAGKLSLRARDIKLEATQGEVSLEATADVVVRGETIRLN